MDVDLLTGEPVSTPELGIIFISRFGSKLLFLAVPEIAIKRLFAKAVPIYLAIFVII